MARSTSSSVEDPSVHETVTALLRERGQRATLPRRTVLAALVQADAEGEHVSVEQLVDRLGAGAPDLSTVYRTVSSLCEVGLVHQTRGESGALYRLLGGRAEAGGHHAHLRCLECGTVTDAPDDVLAPLAVRLADEGFALATSHTVLVGTCADCR